MCKEKAKIYSIKSLTEQNTQQDGRLTFLASMSEQVNLMENQIIKWRYRLPELTDDDSEERVVSAVEVQEDVDEFKEVVLKKLKDLLTNLNALRGEVQLLEREKEESWEAVSHKVSTLVDDSVGALTERLSELEHTVQSRKTTELLHGFPVLGPKKTKSTGFKRKCNFFFFFGISASKQTLGNESGSVARKRWAACQIARSEARNNAEACVRGLELQKISLHMFFSLFFFFAFLTKVLEMEYSQTSRSTSCNHMGNQDLFLND